MNEITSDEQFVEELGRKTGLGPNIANYYWFGGEINPLWAHRLGMTEEELKTWIDKQIDYKGDSDNTHEYFQHLYDKGFLSWEAIDYISCGAYLPDDLAFLCIWGEGYIEYNASAIIECHGLPFFTEDRGFDKEIINELKGLFVGESVSVPELMACMSIIRTA